MIRSGSSEFGIIDRTPEQTKRAEGKGLTNTCSFRPSISEAAIKSLSDDAKFTFVRSRVVGSFNGACKMKWYRYEAAKYRKSLRSMLGQQYRVICCSCIPGLGSELRDCCITITCYWPAQQSGPFAFSKEPPASCLILLSGSAPAQAFRPGVRAFDFRVYTQD